MDPAFPRQFLAVFVRCAALPLADLVHANLAPRALLVVPAPGSRGPGVGLGLGLLATGAHTAGLGAVALLGMVTFVQEVYK